MICCCKDLFMNALYLILSYLICIFVPLASCLNELVSCLNELTSCLNMWNCMIFCVHPGYSMAVANTRDGPVTITGAPRYHHRGVAFVYPKSSDLSIRQRVDPSPWQVCQSEILFETNVQQFVLILKIK